MVCGIITTPGHLASQSYSIVVGVAPWLLVLLHGCWCYSMVVGVAPWLLVLLHGCWCYSMHGCWCCSMVVGVAPWLLVLEKAIGHM